MALTFESPDCPQVCPDLLRQSLDVISTKWAGPLLIQLQLADQARGFADLRRALPSISAKELTKTLRALEDAQVVSRTVIAVVPPRVEYRITAKGSELRAALEALVAWAPGADD